jgi:hypothetical protein
MSAHRPPWSRGCARSRASRLGNAGQRARLTACRSPGGKAPSSAEILTLGRHGHTFRSLNEVSNSVRHPGRDRQGSLLARRSGPEPRNEGTVMTATDPAVPRSVRPVPPCCRPRDGIPNAGRLAPGPRHGLARLGAAPLIARCASLRSRTRTDTRVPPDVRVHVHRDAGLRVPEGLHHGAGRDSGHREESGGVVPDIVQPDRTEAGGLGDAGERDVGVAMACRRTIPTSSR